jgi:photosystem II stability/assembly factor-like uncharacterized protein
MKNRYLLVLLSIVFAAGSFLLFQTGNEEHSLKDYIGWKIDKKQKNPLKYGFPDEAMQWYYDQRAYPLGYIPEGWKEKALMHIEKNNMVLSKSNSASALSWTQAGPGNIGGRVRSIVVHPTDPNVVYIGAVSGGVWKSTNGGDTWTALKDDMENLAVTALAMDPTNSNILYAGTGEGFFNVDAIRGAGIFKTTDAGATWTRLSSTNNDTYYYVNKLIFDNSTNALWAATRKGLFVSTDGGATFIPKLTGNNNADVHCSDVEIGYTTPSTIWAAFGIFNQSEIYRSIDGGNSFSSNFSQPNMGRIELATSVSNPQTVYASFMDLSNYGIGYMGMTTNNGAVWNPINVAGPSFSGADTYAGGQGWYDNIIYVDPNNASILYAGGIDFWKTTNSGNSWDQKSNWYAQGGAPQYVHADQHAIAFAPSNTNIMYLGNDGGVYKSTNKGESWTAKNNGLYITQFYYGAMAPTGNKFYGGTQDNGTIATDGSTSWFEILGGDGGATEVDFVNPNNIYMEYIRFAFFKSTNGGQTFSKKMNGIPTGPNFYDGTTDRTLFITPFSMDPNNSNTIVGGTYRVWRTTDGAENWSAISGDLTGAGSGSSGATISTVIVAKGNSSVIYVGCTNGRVQVTTNGGTDWNLRNNGLPNAYVTRIATDPGNPAIAYATFSGFSNNQKVYKTTNYGVSWTNISSNLPNIPVSCILVSPLNTNHILVGTDLGVFSTTDGGGSWNQDNGGLANVSVADLDYRSSDHKVIAATHGRSMYVTTLSGGGGETQITILQQAFDAAGFPPSGWSTSVTNTSNTWRLGNPQDNSFSAIDPASVNSAICPWVAENQDEWLISPSFSLGSGNASLEFYVAHSTLYLNAATVKLHISNNNGGSWTQLWEAANDGQGFLWRQVTVDLSSYSNSQNLKLAWQYVGNDGDLVALDGIELVGFQFSTGIKDITENIPENFDITQNYPNPFNPVTSFRFSLPQASEVSVVVYDITGSKVAELFNGYQSAGTYEATWNGKNDLGSTVASGTYIYRIKAGKFIQSKKMLLMK